MSYAPVYRLPVDQRPYVTRQVPKQDPQDDAESSSDSDSFRPIDSKDPYLIAGYSRVKPLPPFPFPHAAQKERKPQSAPLDEQLFDLNPPVHIVETSPIPTSSTTKAQHLDNLIVLLHQCMNKGDWDRASRIIGLLLRSDMDGPVNLRRHGRWAIVAEILMRRHTGDDKVSAEAQLRCIAQARQYYERLIVQHPYTAFMKNRFNAVEVYPMLFNLWIYEVHQRSTLARTEGANKKEELEARALELTGAKAIAARMDDILAGPPHDTAANLETRIMVGRWLQDLYGMLPDAEGTEDAGYQQELTREQELSRGYVQKLARLTADE